MTHPIPPGTRDILPDEMRELRALQARLAAVFERFGYGEVRPQRGQMGEFFQAGVELVGAEAPDGTVEVVEVLSAALDAAGLARAVIGLGAAALYPQPPRE